MQLYVEDLPARIMVVGDFMTYSEKVKKLYEISLRGYVSTYNKVSFEEKSFIDFRALDFYKIETLRFGLKLGYCFEEIEDELFCAVHFPELCDINNERV